MLSYNSLTNNDLTNLCLRLHLRWYNNHHEHQDTRYWMHPGKRQPTKDYVRNFKHFMQNEPKFYNPPIILYPCQRRTYNNFYFSDLTKNEPKRTQNKPNLQNAKIKVSLYAEKTYINFHPFELFKNKPNSNPIKPNLMIMEEKPLRQYEKSTHKRPVHSLFTNFYIYLKKKLLLPIIIYTGARVRNIDQNKGLV